jgi:hypothetical protein
MTSDSHEPRRGPRPSLRAVFANWRTYDASFPAKLRMALANNATKLRTRKDCCGNLGQPGC